MAEEPLTENDSHSTNRDEIHRLWLKRIFPALVGLSVVAIEGYLIFGMKGGGFSNTNDPIAHAMERVIFGSMCLLPTVVPFWGLAMFGVCHLGKPVHLGVIEKRGTDKE